MLAADLICDPSSGLSKRVQDQVAAKNVLQKPAVIWPRRGRNHRPKVQDVERLERVSQTPSARPRPFQKGVERRIGRGGGRRSRPCRVAAVDESRGMRWRAWLVWVSSRCGRRPSYREHLQRIHPPTTSSMVSLRCSPTRRHFRNGSTCSTPCSRNHKQFSLRPGAAGPSMAFAVRHARENRAGAARIIMVTSALGQ